MIIIFVVILDVHVKMLKTFDEQKENGKMLNKVTLEHF